MKAPVVAGVWARAKSCAARVSSWSVSLSFKHTFSISYVHPPGPGDEPHGAVRRQVAKTFGSNFNSHSGTKSRTCCGMGLWTSCGRLLRNSVNVSSFLGARDAPVNSCLAFEIWPLSTLLCAAAPLRAFSSPLHCGSPTRTTSHRASLSNSDHLPASKSSTLWASSDLPRGRTTSKLSLHPQGRPPTSVSTSRAMR